MLALVDDQEQNASVDPLSASLHLIEEVEKL
jgi:hypothetical protein